MASDLKYLIYVSIGSPTLTDGNIESILATSHTNNAKNEITGMMLFVEGRFFQVLEGNEKSIDELFDKISNDPRHRDPIVVATGDLDKRIFKDWTMRYNSISEEEFARISGINKFQSLFGLKPKTPNNPAWLFAKRFTDKSFPSDSWWDN